ncbi:hypothetical protein WL1483_2316 [Aeromonas schubertii]|uniref:Uncharacterized protein n=1 Tax=Aeromonas schubertii TaxID=652 RepID=A0A0S2SJ70_9GAMM|nr:hypothetical protein WL1483_2316 [Aeromonas schubertii]
MGGEQNLGATAHRHYDAGGETRIDGVPLAADHGPLPISGDRRGSAVAAEAVAAAKVHQLPGATGEAKGLLVAGLHQGAQGGKALSRLLLPQIEQIAGAPLPVIERLGAAIGEGSGHDPGQAPHFKPQASLTAQDEPESRLAI